MFAQPHHDHAHGEAGHVCSSSCQHEHHTASQAADELFAAPKEAPEAPAPSATDSGDYQPPRPKPPAEKPPTPEQPKPTPAAAPEVPAVHKPRPAAKPPAPVPTETAIDKPPVPKPEAKATPPPSSQPKETSKPPIIPPAAPVVVKPSAPERPAPPSPEVAPLTPEHTPTALPSAEQPLTPTPPEVHEQPAPREHMYKQELPLPITETVEHTPAPSPEPEPQALELTAATPEPELVDMPLIDTTLATPEFADTPETVAEEEIAPLNLSPPIDPEFDSPIIAHSITETDGLSLPEPLSTSEDVDAFALPTIAQTAELGPATPDTFTLPPIDTPHFTELPAIDSDPAMPETTAAETLPPRQLSEYMLDVDSPQLEPMPTTQYQRNTAPQPAPPAEQAPAVPIEHSPAAIHSPEVQRLLAHLHTLSRRGGSYPATRQLVHLLAAQLGVSPERARELLNLTADYQVTTATAQAIAQLSQGGLASQISVAPQPLRVSWLARLRQAIRRRFHQAWVRINRTVPLAYLPGL